MTRDEIRPTTREELEREYRARLRQIPSMESLLAMRPTTLDEAIERTRLIGERAALERLLNARRVARG